MIPATYFDGQTARRVAVTLMLHKGVVALSGDGVRRSIRLSRIVVSERLEHAPRILRLPEGGCIESSDARLEKMLRKNGYREPRVVRWQRNWPLSLLALVSLLALLIAGYQWGLPWAADTIARHLPASIEEKIGDEQLALLDSGYMEPSRLDPVQQARLQRLFAELKQPHGDNIAYRLEFRHAEEIGANAFALPNGVIVMTDQLVSMADDEQAVLGVLGHELGHVRGRHSLRRLLQGLGVGVVVHMFIGDVSSVLAAVPGFLLDQKYSRDFERESDRYAIDMMRENGIPLSPMAALFEKMSHDGDHADEEEDDGGQDELFDYLSSHPGDAERIARLRAADANR